MTTFTSLSPETICDVEKSMEQLNLLREVSTTEDMARGNKLVGDIKTQVVGRVVTANMTKIALPQEYTWPDFPITTYDQHNPLQAEIFNSMRPYFRSCEGSTVDWMPRQALFVAKRSYTGLVVDVDGANASLVMANKRPWINHHRNPFLPFTSRVWVRMFNDKHLQTVSLSPVEERSR